MIVVVGSECVTHSVRVIAKAVSLIPSMGKVWLYSVEKGEESEMSRARLPFVWFSAITVLGPSRVSAVTFWSRDISFELGLDAATVVISFLLPIIIGEATSMSPLTLCPSSVALTGKIWPYGLMGRKLFSELSTMASPRT